MANSIQQPLAYHRHFILERLLVISGIIASLYYIAINIIVGLQYEGYSFASQTVSELSAINAPTRSLWVTLMYFYTFLVLCFGWGVYISGRNNRPLRMAGILIFFHSLVGIFWPPMHQREVLAAGGGTMTDTLHIVFTVIAILFMLLIIMFAAASLTRRFRVYSILTIKIMGGMGMLTFNGAPVMEAELPTPGIGIWERIRIGPYMGWKKVSWNFPF